MALLASISERDFFSSDIAAAAAALLRFRLINMNPSKIHDGAASTAMTMLAIAPPDRVGPGTFGRLAGVSVTRITSVGITEGREVFVVSEMIAEVCITNPSN